jgi:hypothetical protein
MYDCCAVVLSTLHIEMTPTLKNEIDNVEASKIDFVKNCQH